MKLSQLSLADYNKIDNIPVINQDLSASGFTPVANTYYRHIGATTGTYTQGVIYCYDGTEYKALDGSGGGGISDVQVNGKSVVTDGVANIPAASRTDNGIVTTGDQVFGGLKTFYRQGIKLDAGSWGHWVICPSNQQLDLKAVNNGSYTQDIRMGIVNSDTANLSTYIAIKPFSADKMIELYKSGFNRIAIYQGYTGKRLYLDTDIEGTAMATPSTWSSGTSGSVTLTEVGTYQIYMNDGKNNKNFGVVYWDGSTETSTQVAMDNADTGYFAKITNGVITAYDVNFVGNTYTANTNTIYYRRIGI